MFRTLVAIPAAVLAGWFFSKPIGTAIDAVKGASGMNYTPAQRASAERLLIERYGAGSYTLRRSEGFADGAARLIFTVPGVSRDAVAIVDKNNAAKLV